MGERAVTRDAFGLRQEKGAGPPGQRDKVEIPLRLVLPRAVLERLTARAIR